MVVVGVEGMLEGQSTLPYGMLHCWIAADGVCNLLQAVFSPPPAASQSSTLQQQEGLIKAGCTSRQSQISGRKKSHAFNMTTN